MLPAFRSLASVALFAVATNPLAAQWTNATQSVPSSANISFAPLARSGRVTWKQIPPTITRVVGKTFTDHDTFVILPTPNMPAGFSPTIALSGTHLGDVTWQIGALPITTISAKTDTSATLALPLNASSGLVCATANGNRGCSTVQLAAFGRPVLQRTPLLPLALRTNYTIDGLNLLPPGGVAGLKYRFTMSGLDSNATTMSCNMMLQIVDHTANHIVVRVGDPAKTAPLPASCAADAHFQQSGQWSMNISATLLGVPAAKLLLNQIPFYLKH
jgi:hypothetical protein